MIFIYIPADVQTNIVAKQSSDNIRNVRIVFTKKFFEIRIPSERSKCILQSKCAFIL